MSELSSLHELFIHELRDIASAERQLTAALPRFTKIATNQSLRSALESNLAETERHLRTVMGLLGSFGADKSVQRCLAMTGILDEAGTLLRLQIDPDVRDSAVIVSVQKAEHYEICAYGTLRAWADRMGHEEAACAFDEILRQQRDADERLTDVADSIDPYGRVGRGFVPHDPARQAGHARRVSGIAQGV